MRFESKSGPKREKKKKICFVSWKVYFSSCYYLIIPFPLRFKDDF
jgi:hypothetical protein